MLFRANCRQLPPIPTPDIALPPSSQLKPGYIPDDDAFSGGTNPSSGAKGDDVSLQDRPVPSCRI
jgi:hypothetical protein